MTFEALLRAQYARYPHMQIQDEYKLVHQAALGSEHAVDNPDAARQWLIQEAAALGPGPDEPVFDPISADGRIVRVHLRPYVAGGGDLESLLEAFLRTANEVRGDPRLLAAYWEIAARVGIHPYAEMHTFLQVKAAAGFPAGHHSPEFSRQYRPAYRVIRIDWFKPGAGSSG